MRVSLLFAVLTLLVAFGCASGPKVDMGALNGESNGSEATFRPGNFRPDPMRPADSGKGKWEETGKPITDGMNEFIANATPWTDRIFFDFNRYEIKDEQRKVLDALAEHLEKNAELAVVIEGHCDERGSSEYNRALGERRSLAVRTYLTDSGIAEERLFTVSYGSDRPEVADARTEEEHAKNRRCQFLLGTRK